MHPTRRHRPSFRALCLIGAIVISLGACSSVATPTPSPSPTPTPSPSPTPSPTPTPSPSPTPTPSPTPNPFEGKRVTVLILGNDSTPSRVALGLGKLTDAIIVLSVNAARTKVSLISFPRDIVDIPLGNGGIWRSKINAISYFDGEKVMVQAISATLNQPIDYYIEMSMNDFSALVDSIGGVDVNVPMTIIDPSIHFSIKAGPQHLNGTQALGFARSRHTTSDWDRDARQQLLVAAIIRRMVDPTAGIDFIDLLGSLKSLQTDIPLDRIGPFFELAREAANAKVVKKVLAPPQFATFWGIEQGTGRGYIQEPNIAAIRAYAASVMGKK